MTVSHAQNTPTEVLNITLMSCAFSTDGPNHVLTATNGMQAFVYTVSRSAKIYSVIHKTTAGPRQTDREDKSPKLPQNTSHHLLTERAHYNNVVILYPSLQVIKELSFTIKYNTNVVSQSLKVHNSPSLGKYSVQDQCDTAAL